MELFHEVVGLLVKLQGSGIKDVEMNSWMTKWGSIGGIDNELIPQLFTSSVF